MNFKNSYWILIIIGILSCNQKSVEKETQIIKDPKIVSFDNKLAFNEFRRLNLDSTYTNLLDPSNVNESEHKAVLESWTEFHKKITKFIKEENFNGKYLTQR